MREGASAWQHDALIVGASRTPWFVPIAFTILAKGSVPQAVATIGEIVFLRNLTVKSQVALVARTLTIMMLDANRKYPVGNPSGASNSAHATPPMLFRMPRISTCIPG
jgi:hypothetical protein